MSTLTCCTRCTLHHRIPRITTPTTTTTQHTRTLWSKTRRNVPRHTPTYYENRADIQADLHARQPAVDDATPVDLADTHYRYAQQVHGVKQKYLAAIAQQHQQQVSRETNTAFKKTMHQYRLMKHYNALVLPIHPPIVHTHTPPPHRPAEMTEQFQREIVADQRTLAVYDRYLDNATAPADAPTQPQPTGQCFAVFEINKQQVKASANDLIMVNKLRGEDITVGTRLLFDNVLLLGSTTHTVVGRPYITGATVECVIEESTQTSKVLVFKMRRRKNSRSLQGYRSQVMFLRVVKVTYPDQMFDIAPADVSVQDDSAGRLIDTTEDGEEDEMEADEEELAEQLQRQSKH